jgi:hypothetical protein
MIPFSMGGRGVHQSQPGIIRHCKSFYIYRGSKVGRNDLGTTANHFTSSSAKCEQLVVYLKVSSMDKLAVYN